MKILLFGADGQVGWQLQRALAPIGDIKICNKVEADLENLSQVKELIQNYNPDVIVNAAAYTAVDKAEKEIKKATSINAIAPAIIAHEAKKIDALLVHYSTDYVFDGKKSSGYNENDITNPLSIYGKTKLEGENKIIESGCKYLIFRTSWVYSLKGSNFIKTIIRLAKEKKELKIVADQIGSPTSADFIADVTAHCIVQAATHKQYGTYNLTASGEVSWYKFAKLIIEELHNAGIELKTLPHNITPINTNQHPLPAQRPQYSKLNTDKLQKTFNLNVPNWQHHVKLMLDTYSNK